MQIKLFSGFFARTFWPIAALVLLLSAFFTFVLIDRQSGLLEQDLIANGSSLAAGLADASELGVFAESPEFLDEAVHRTADEKHIAFVGVYTLTGIQLAAEARLPSISDSYSDLSANRLKLAQTNNYAFNLEKTYGNTALFEFWAPVVASARPKEEDMFLDLEPAWDEEVGQDQQAKPTEAGKVIGMVIVSIARSGIDERMQQFVLTSVTITLIFLPIGLIIAFFMAKGITGPLLALTKGVESVEEGGTYERIHLRQENEIGHLAASYNRMADQVQTREEALKKAMWEAEAAARAKSEFLAVMSHEIRTPMSGVLGMAELLEETELNEEQQEFVRVISKSGYNLLAILDDILDISKIEANKMQLDPTPFDLIQTANDVKQLMLQRAEEKGLKLVMHYEPGCPKFLVADAGRLRQVLLNLVGNAIKFTKHGHVLIEVTCPSQDDEKADIHLEIQDTGIGIKEEAREKLFTPFTQADSSTTREFGGTGLGLSICKRLIDLMGGSIGVNSTLDQGSTFWINLSLPIAPNAEELEQDSGLYKSLETSEALERIPSGLMQGSILLVEDNQTNQKVATAILQRLGLSITLATTGKEAIEHWQDGNHDLILMDCQMPEMDGYEATRIIRSREEDTHIPIVALTANAMAQDRERCLEAGMDDYIAKPINRNNVAPIISQWLLAGEEVPLDDEIKAPLIIQDGFDISALARLRASIDSESYAELIATYVKNTTETLAKMAQAHKAEDTRTLTRLAHNIKSTSSALGAVALSDLARQLEDDAKHDNLYNACQDIEAMQEEFERIANEPSFIFPEDENF